MTAFLALVLTFTILGISGTFAYGPWTGHKVIRITPHSIPDVQSLMKLLSSNQKLDVWRTPSGVNNSVDIRLSPSEFNDVTNYLKNDDIEVNVLIEDVQDVIDKQKAKRKAKHSPVNEFDYTKYHELDDIYDWLQNVSMVYKDRVTMINITESYEGRELVGIKISTQQGVNKPAFWIEGGIHAREWISPATVLYIAGQMLDEYKFDTKISDMVDSFDWYILPVTNPDGYAYTWKNDKARLWRKTRSKHGLCIGVDPNRNWDMEWCKEGSSKNPCSDTYCGPSAFSEVEVKGVADFLSKIENLKGFIDFHSYSQLWMSPWGYTHELPEDFKAQDEGSKLAVEALEKNYGTKYKHGSIANTVYVASGSSADWTYGKLGIKYSYGVELRDTGKYGFLLPDDQILPSGRETLQALIALADYVHNN